MTPSWASSPRWTKGTSPRGERCTSWAIRRYAWPTNQRPPPSIARQLAASDRCSVRNARMSSQPTTDDVSAPGWVLVIVRDQHLRQLLLSMLSLAGYAHQGWSTLAEAEQVLHEHASPKLMLLDGDATGETLLRALIQHLF